jgi:hypothetical protein
MKRTALLLAVVLLLSVPRLSHAEQLPGLIAAGVGYLSNIDSVAVAVNLDAGTPIAVFGGGLDFVSTTGLCGLGRSGAPGLLISGSSATVRQFVVPVSDFYMYLCLRLSGFSGDFYAAILHSAFDARDADEKPGAAGEDTAELEAAVQAAIDRKFGR